MKNKIVLAIIGIIGINTGVYSQSDAVYGYQDTASVYDLNSLNLGANEDIYMPEYDKTEAMHRSLAASYNIPYITDEDIQQKLMLIPSEIPLSYTPEIAKIIRTYVYTKREYLTRMLTLSQVYFPIFEDVFLLKGLPLELKYLSVVESALKPHARSRCGATGLWQFMPYTAKSEGMHIGSYIDERKDVYKSTEFAADFLRKLYSNHGNDWFLALAAYNSGSGNVSKAIRNSQGYDFWTIKHRLPRETQSYVPSYIAIFYCMYYSSDYNLFPDKPQFSFSNTTRERIYDPLSLKHLAEVVGSCEEELLQYNPSLKRGIIPASANGFDLVLPKQYLSTFYSSKDQLLNDPYLQPTSIVDNTNVAATDMMIAASTEAYNQDNNSKNSVTSLKEVYSQVIEQKVVEVPNTATNDKYKIVKVTEINTKKTDYRVKKGDNLHQIADKFNTTVAEIREWNDLSSSSNIHTGQVLTLYTKEKTVKPQYIMNTPATYASKAVSSRTENVSETNQKQIVHIIKKGETLMALTRLYGVTLDQLKEWNFLDDRSTNVKVGQEIYVYTGNSDEHELPVIKNYSYYEVLPGDTLQTASARLNVPVETLKSLNNKDANEPLKSGEKIKVPAL